MIAGSFSWLPKVFAGTLSSTTVLETGNTSQANPMITGDQQGLAIEFDTANTTTGTTTVTLTFAGSWTTNSGTIATTQPNPSASGCNGSSGLFGASNGGSGATTLPGTLTAAGSGSVITISGVTALAASTYYCIEIPATSTTEPVVNPTAGSYNIAVATASDSQTVSEDVLSSGANAYNITATVAPTFTMSLSGSGTDTFPGNLSSSSVTVSSGITTTIVTNAKSGWYVWVRDSNAGLTSTQASKTIPTVPADTNETMNSGTYGPGMNTTASVQ